MRAKRFFWMRHAMFLAGLCCGSAGLANAGDAPAPPSPPPHRHPSPWADAAAPARRPYAAATPAEAVAWLAAAGKSEDLEAAIEALALPVGPMLQDLRTATAQMEEAMNKYKAARDARSGSAAHSSPAQEFERERQKRAAAEKYVVQEMKILSQEAIGDQGAAARLVVRTTMANARGETQTRTGTYRAVRSGNAWRLLPEPLWNAVLDEKEAELMKSHLIKQVEQRRAMRAAADQATQALAAGQPLHEVELSLVATYNRLLTDVRLPSAGGGEPRTAGTDLVKGLNAMIWGEAMPRQDPSPRAPQSPPGDNNR